ncbi:hypothetical protein LG3211_1787 [Lysobacter gummosus]|nr:hypothetical protein LG3211_1787 [Lysobacter gummosus]
MREDTAPRLPPFQARRGPVLGRRNRRRSASSVRLTAIAVPAVRPSRNARRIRTHRAEPSRPARTLREAGKLRRDHAHILTLVTDAYRACFGIETSCL